jgi:hypothetical protein
VIRQLRRLTRPVGDARSGASALAVYAEASGDGFTLRAASGLCMEGVACVDDAARAAILYCTVWRQHSAPWAAEAAQGLLRFLTSMQDEDGRFVNFILDWDGRKNRTGPTSVAGGWWWAARALHALAWGFATFGEPEYARAFNRGIPWLQQSTDNLDVRALCVLAALEHTSASGDGGHLDQALAWAEEIAASRLGDVLPNIRGEPRIHLWGRFQEVALVNCGLRFGRPDLIRLARASARALLLPHCDSGFAERTTIPFDVSCTIQGLDAVAQATHQDCYQEGAKLARAWFWGRNMAGRPVYDAYRGVVFDGIDDGRLNPNSGAEANIEGALGLRNRVTWRRVSRSSRVPAAPWWFRGTQARRVECTVP